MNKFKENFYALKKMDHLGKQVEMEINSKHSKHSKRYKTWPGFILTLICLVLGTSYLGYLIHRMNSGDKD